MAPLGALPALLLLLLALRRGAAQISFTETSASAVVEELKALHESAPEVTTARHAQRRLSEAGSTASPAPPPAQCDLATLPAGVATLDQLCCLNLTIPSVPSSFAACRAAPVNGGEGAPCSIDCAAQLVALYDGACRPLLDAIFDADDGGFDGVASIFDSKYRTCVGSLSTPEAIDYLAAELDRGNCTEADVDGAGERAAVAAVQHQCHDSRAQCHQAIVDTGAFTCAQDFCPTCELRGQCNSTCGYCARHNRRALQERRGAQCDLKTFADRADEINHACCDHDNCPNGVPTTCDAKCAIVYDRFFNNCSDVMATQFSGPEMQAFVRLYDTCSTLPLRDILGAVAKCYYGPREKEADVDECEYSFRVQSGPCIAHNNCVGRTSYGDDESCTIVPTSSFTLGSCPEFDTESRYDYVTIDGTQYDGNQCPSMVHVSPSSTIAWHSDGSASGAGWEICANVGNCHYGELPRYSCVAPCANGGRCDYATGTCACAEGWFGDTCAIDLRYCGTTDAQALLVWRDGLSAVPDGCPVAQWEGDDACAFGGVDCGDCVGSSRESYCRSGNADAEHPRRVTAVYTSPGHNGFDACGGIVGTLSPCLARLEYLRYLDLDYIPGLSGPVPTEMVNGLPHLNSRLYLWGTAVDGPSCHRACDSHPQLGDNCYCP
eukprot:SAG31_NODE_3880_length_3789_cov_8.522764_1_plen_662_part_00